MAVDQKPLASHQKSWLLKPLRRGPSWAMIHGEFPLFLLTIHGAWRSASGLVPIESILFITAPANMGNIAMTQQHHVSTSWAKGVPWPTNIKGKPHLKGEILLQVLDDHHLSAEVGAEQPTRPTTKHQTILMVSSPLETSLHHMLFLGIIISIISIVHRTYLKPLSAWVMTAMRSLDGPRFRGFGLQICDMTSQMGSMG